MSDYANYRDILDYCVRGLEESQGYNKAMVALINIRSIAQKGLNDFEAEELAWDHKGFDDEDIPF